MREPGQHGRAGRRGAPGSARTDRSNAGWPTPAGQPPAGQDPAAAKQALQQQINQQHPSTFEQTSAELTQEGQESVTKIGELAEQAPQDVRLQVLGHVAKTGSPENAQRLSQERARAVVDKLTAAGVPADRMEVVGKGDAEPKENVETSRRVEIMII